MKLPSLMLALCCPLVMAPLSGAARVPVAKAVPSLCQPGEAVIFACRAGAKWIAVCGNAQGGGGQYRYGTPGKVELVYPANAADSGLSWANTAYSGGGETQVNFANGGFRYTIYSRMIRTGFGADGNKPEFESGVLVKQGDHVASERKCTDPYDAPVDLDAAQKALPEGEFQDN